MEISKIGIETNIENDNNKLQQVKQSLERQNLAKSKNYDTGQKNI